MVSELPRHGDRPSLDFVNTVDPREPFGRDFLPDYASFLDWVKTAGLLERKQVASVAASARRSPRRADAAHRRAIEVRELLYDVFRAGADGRVPTPALRRRLSQVADALVGRRHLDWRNGGFVWDAVPADQLDLPLQAIVADAVELLLDEERIGRCAADGCGWLFLDTTRNHSRRWCSMAGCGNRAKSRRHYYRHRKAA